MELFKLVGRILVDSDEANDSISKTEKSAGGLTDGLGKVAKGAAVVTGAVAAAGGVIMNLAEDGAAAADTIDKASQKMGFSREAYQEWDYIASQNGATIDSLQGGLTALAEKMDDASEGAGEAYELFNRLGVDPSQYKTQEEAFEAVVIALQGMEDGAEKTAIASKLLGGAGEELLPLLNAEVGSVDELKNAAHDLGLVMSDDVIDAGVGLTDTLDNLQRVGSAALVPVLAGIMPLVQKIADLIIQYMPQIMAIVTPLIDGIMPIFSDLVMSLFPVLIDILTMLLADVLPAILPLIQVVVEKLLPPLVGVLGTLGGTLFPIIADVLVVVAQA